MKKMKICMVGTGTPGVPPKGGGGLERVIYELTRALSKLGYEIVLIDTSCTEERDIDADLSFCNVIRVSHFNLVRFHSLPLKYLLHEFVRLISAISFALALIPSIGRLLLSNKYDVIHVHNRYTFLATKFAQILSRTDTPIIFTCHNGSLMKKHYPLWLRIYWIPEWVALRSATRITTMSKALKEAIVRFALLDEKAANRVDVIPNGVDTSSFYPRSSINNNKNVHIVCVSHIVRIKGQKYAIEAIKLLKQRGFKNIKLLLVGAVIDSDYYQELLQLIKTYNLEPNVTFMGRVPHCKIWQLLNDAFIAIWPSGRDQGMPLTVLEYLACGKPVLVRKALQLEEVLPEGVVMYFSDVEELADKIAQLLGNDSLRTTLQKNARTFVESRYDWLKIASMMAETYYRALQGANCFGSR